MYEMENDIVFTRVLISTYWNVNSFGFWTSNIIQDVLISTYWNVNVDCVSSYYNCKAF